MKKRLHDRKRLLQFALSLCLILMSANLSWGQTPIPLTNGDCSGTAFTFGTTTGTFTPEGYTIVVSSSAALNISTSGVNASSSGTMKLKGTNGSANNMATITTNKVDISSYPVDATFNFQCKLTCTTITSQAQPYNVIIIAYATDGITVVTTNTLTLSKVQPNTNVNAGTAQTIGATAVMKANTVTLGSDAKYIAFQLQMGKMLSSDLKLDDFTLTKLDVAPAVTTGMPSNADLSYELGNGPSSESTFTVSGAGLGSNNIVLTPATNIEISTTPSSGFVANPSTLSLIPTSGTVNSTTIYTRLKSGIGAFGAVGASSARVTVFHNTAGTKLVQFTGTVNGINTSASTGSALSYVAGSGPSAEVSFTVTTNGLTNDLVVTPGSDLEVSTTSGSSFQPTPITFLNTTISQVIYSRLKAGISAGSYSGASTAVVISSTGFTSVTKQFTGTITDPPTTWDGSIWSNGTPISSQDAIINSNFSTTASGITAGFSAKTLTVNATKTFTINPGHNITVAGAVTNNGTFTVENNANLIQVNNVANTGTATVKRNSASIQLYDYTLWSSPVTGQDLRTFSNSTLATRFYTYNSASNLYNVVDFASPVNFATATGYLIRAPNDHLTTPMVWNGTFTGVPNNGNQGLSSLTPDKYYATGNPYPSTISADLFLTGNTTGGTLYFWRKTNNALTSSYATYTLAGGTGTGTANSGDPLNLTPNGTIQVGQGFIVKTGLLATTLNFTNAMRTANNDNQFLRTTNEKSRYWLNLTSTTGAFCQTMVAYMPEATSGVDNAIDGKYINDAPIALTSIINAEEYTIQGRALPFATTDTVPLGFKTNATGNYTIAIDHVDGLFSTGQTVFLKDNLLNTVINLSAGSYSFASAIGTFNSRFEVVYQSTLAVTNPTFTANSVIAYSANSEIRINSGSTIMERVRVYDLQGRLLVEKNQVNATETKLSTTASNQVLLVEITAANGSKVTKKIIQ